MTNFLTGNLGVSSYCPAKSLQARVWTGRSRWSSSAQRRFHRHSELPLILGFEDHHGRSIYTLDQIPSLFSLERVVFTRITSKQTRRRSQHPLRRSRLHPPVRMRKRFEKPWRTSSKAAEEQHPLRTAAAFGTRQNATVSDKGRLRRSGRCSLCIVACGKIFARK